MVKKLIQTGFLHIFSTSVLNKIITFFSTIILVRIVSKSDYGVFTYAWNIYEFATLLSGLGIAAAVLQVGSENYNNQYKQGLVYSYGFRFVTIVNIVLALLLIGIGTFVSLPINEAGNLVSLISGMLILFGWTHIQAVYLRITLQNKKYAKHQIVGTISTVVFTIIGAFVLAAKGMVIGRYIGYIITVLFGYFILRIPSYNNKYKELKEEEKNDLVKIAIVSMSMNGLSQVLHLLDVFVIGIVMTNELDVASYKVATQIPTALSFIPSAVVVYIYPFFAKHIDDPQWCLKRYKQALGGVGLANIVFSISLFLLAPILITGVYGNNYADAIIPFRILAVSYFFSGTFRSITANLLTAQRKLNFNLMISALSGGLKLVFSFLFITWWGITGAAISTIAITIIISFINVFYYLRVLKLKLDK